MAGIRNSLITHNFTFLNDSASYFFRTQFSKKYIRSEPCLISTCQNFFEGRTKILDSAGAVAVAGQTDNPTAPTIHQQTPVRIICDKLDDACLLKSSVYLTGFFALLVVSVNLFL